jgi:hypothetical protein
MRSDFSKSSFPINSTPCSYLQQVIGKLMPRLHPSWKRILLQDSHSGITAIEVARTILQQQKRQDVKVCLSQRRQDCYSPFFNLIGLSEEVVNSRSVVAVAIATHEVGHALQPTFVNNWCNVLRNSILPHLAFGSEFSLLMTPILLILTTQFPSVIANQNLNPILIWKFRFAKVLVVLFFPFWFLMLLSQSTLAGVLLLPIVRRQMRNEKFINQKMNNLRQSREKNRFYV